MSSSIRTTAVLAMLVATIYILRSSNVTPNALMKSGIARYLDSEDITAYFCKGVPTSNPYSASSQSRAESLRASFKKSRKEVNTLSGMIDKEEPKDMFVKDYAVSLLPMLLPWVIFFVLAVIGCFSYATSWCCTNLKMCAGLACRCCQPSKSTKLKTLFAVFSLVLMVGAIGAGITGIIFSVKLPGDSNKAMCFTLRAIDQVQNGNMDKQWIGITPIVNSIDTVTSDIESAMSQLTAIPPVIQSLADELNSPELNDNMTLLTNSVSVTINRADPAVESQYTPDYITNLISLTSPFGGIFGSLLVESTVKLFAVQSINTSVVDLINTTTPNANDAVSLIRTAEPAIQEVNNYVNAFKSNVSNAKNTIVQIMHIIVGVILGLFIANIVVSVLAITAIALVCCGAKAFNKGVQFSWCLLGALMVVGWIISTVLFSLSIFVMEGCDVGDRAMSDSLFYNKTFHTFQTYFNVYDSNFNQTRDVLYTCIYKNGNLADYYGVSPYLATIDDIMNQIKTYNDLANSAITTIPDSVVIPAAMGYLNQYHTGQVVDSQETATDLIKLNSLTRSAANDCTKMNDVWLLTGDSCTSAAGTAFTSTSSATFNENQATCIGLDTWKNSGNDVAGRYNLEEFPQPSCGTVNGKALDVYLDQFVNSFIANRAESQAKAQTVADALNGVQGLNKQFMNDLQQLPVAIQGINNTVSNLYGLLAGPTGGITNAQCSFATEEINAVLDVACTGLGQTLFRTGVVFIIMSFFGFVGTFMLFCLARRFTLEDYKDKLEMYKRNAKE